MVGVWIGNADGEGRPEIRGVNVAGPILFDVFDILPDSKWFEKPFDDMFYAKICTKSGMIASRNCNIYREVLIPKSGIYAETCKYHKIVHLDKKEQYQVDSSNYPVSKMIHKSWFVLPPIQEWYYKKKNSSYKVLPPSKNEVKQVMELIYPHKETKIFVPVELDGTCGKTVFELAHRRPDSVVYWHLDTQYIGETQNIHQMGFYPKEGEHTRVIIDAEGNCLTQTFEIITRVKPN